MVTVPNPGVPYVKMSIGGTDVTDSEDRRLVSFDFADVIDSVPKVTITLLDTKFDYIEGLLEEQGNKIDFQFGWYGSEDPSLWTKSPISMYAIKWRPSIFDSYAKITIECEMASPELQKAGINPQTDTAKQIDTALSDKSGNSSLSVSDMVKQIFGENGLGFNTDLVEETAPLAERHISTKSSKAVSPKIIMTGQAAIQAWNNHWKRLALDKKGHDDLPVKQEQEPKKGSKAVGGYFLFFIPFNPPKVGLTRGNSGTGKLVATYNYPESPYEDREVISFNYEQSIMAFSNDAQHSQTSIGTETGTGTALSMMSTARGQFPGPKGPFKKEPKFSSGFMSAGFLSPPISAINSKELVQSTSASYHDKSMQINRATLVIFGRPDLNINDRVKINVWMNSGYQVSGDSGGGRRPHYTSGEWTIDEIHHRIDPGNFQTTLALQKFSGVELEPITEGVNSAYAGDAVKFMIAMDADPPNNTDIEKAYWPGGSASA